MVIGQQMKKEEHDQIIYGFLLSLAIQLLLS